MGDDVPDLPDFQQWVSHEIQQGKTVQKDKKVKQNGPGNCSKVPEVLEDHKQEIGNKQDGQEQQRTPDKLISVILPDEFIKLADQYAVIVSHVIFSLLKNDNPPVFIFAAKVLHS
jgi:hypothetical protein